MTALQLLNIKYVNPIRADKLCSNRKVDRVKKCRNSQLEAIKKGTFGCNAWGHFYFLICCPADQCDKEKMQ